MHVLEESSDRCPRVAQYVRMSTDKQDLSIDRQLLENEKFAEQHNLQIVETYTDAAKSGLTLGKRQGLLRLLNDIRNGEPNFSAVLVYDISRWGRFQDTDESAYYEFACRKRGVEIIYTCEPLVSGNGVMSTVVKAIKRAMATEYSRELSIRVATSKVLYAEKGFSQGGAPGFGLRRMMVDKHGEDQGLIRFKEIKAFQSYRVNLVHGPEEEVEAVRDIFRLFAEEEISIRRIVKHLNDAGLETPYGNPISRSYVRGILTNRKYIGEFTYGKTETRFATGKKDLPPERWVVVKNAIPPIVSREVFDKAAARLATYKPPINVSDEEMLLLLNRLLSERGYLSQEMINQCDYTPHASTFVGRFGSLREAYRRIGYLQETGINHAIRARNKQDGKLFFTAANRLSDEEMLSRLKKLLSERGRLSKQIIDECGYLPSSPVFVRRFGGILNAYRLVGYEPSKRTRKGYL